MCVILEITTVPVSFFVAVSNTTVAVPVALEVTAGAETTCIIVQEGITGILFGRRRLRSLHGAVIVHGPHDDPDFDEALIMR